MAPDHPRTLTQENALLRRAIKDLCAVNNLASAIGGTNDIRRIIKTTVRMSVAAVGAERGVVTLASQEGEVSSRTSASTNRDASPEPDEVLLRFIMHYARPIVANSPVEYERLFGIRCDTSVESVLCVPMPAKSGVIGALTLYNKTDHGTFTDADKRLVSIFAAQSAQVLENLRRQEDIIVRDPIKWVALWTAKLRQTTANQLIQELQLARDIQAKLLPQQRPEVKGFDIAGTSIPARSVGGDFYDFRELGSNTFRLWVGDVSGKGLPASLTMATTQASLRAESGLEASAANCVAAVNRHLCATTPRGTFVTLFFGQLDVASSTLTYVNAGHNRPLHIRSDGHVQQLELGDLVLGFSPEIIYREDRLEFAEGDALIVYSDGVTESLNTEREQYTAGRLQVLLQNNRELGAEATVNAILESVADHSAGFPQVDDLTLAVVKRTMGQSTEA